VISDSDTRSLRHLDLWLERIDTEKTHYNFKVDEVEEHTQEVNLDWNRQPELIRAVARDNNFGALRHVKAADELSPLLQFLWETSADELTRKVFVHHLEAIRSMQHSSIQADVLEKMIAFLDFTPSMVVHFMKLRPWNELADEYQVILNKAVPKLLRALVLCARKADTLILTYWTQILEELRSKSIEQVKSLIELISLTIPSAPLALSMLVDGLEPYSGQISHLSPSEGHFLLKSLSAIAIDHIEEAPDSTETPDQTRYDWKFDKPLKEKEGDLILECSIRIDAPKAGHLSMGDLVVFTSISTPSHVGSFSPAAFEALVQSAEVGQARFLCLRRPPPFFQQCTWRLNHYGSFVTSRTMIETVVTLMVERDECCGVFRSLFPEEAPPTDHESSLEIAYANRDNLNESQNRAIEASLRGPITCIWGPPGCGKTTTITSLIQELLARDSNERVLVTAPTHNAVDNVMRQYVKNAAAQINAPQEPALRVSTEVSSDCAREFQTDFLRFGKYRQTY
jgi:hypothetical protein